MPLCFDKGLKPIGGRLSSPNLGRFFAYIGFFPVLSSHPGMANKIVRLVQYEGNKFGQCRPLTTQDGQA
jgi:hypothetical protein